MKRRSTISSPRSSRILAFVAPFRIGTAWICFVPASAHQIASRTEDFPAPLRPVISTSSPVGVISTARSFFTFSAVSFRIFIYRSFPNS